MTFRELVEKNRSYRRFDADSGIAVDALRELVDLARHTPSAMNRQPLKYLLVCGPEANERVFDNLAWAGSLPDWDGPEPHERPAAYIIILTDRALNAHADRDVGIAAQTILLGAVERGLGGCMLGAITRPGLRAAFNIDEELEIALVVALGKPAETIVLEDAAPGADITYYREPDGTHHVPKRTLGEIIIAVEE